MLNPGRIIKVKINNEALGGGTGGAEGAKAPPVLKQQGLSPPRNSLQPCIKVTFISKTGPAVIISSFYLEKKTKKTALNPTTENYQPFFV